MVQSKLENYQNFKFLLYTLKTMLDKHKHSFSKVDLYVSKEKHKELIFYHSLLSKKYIPKQAVYFSEQEVEKTLYHLLIILDKYSIEINSFQKLIFQFEEFKKQINN
ncbi:MAG: hypothetical protein EAZ53_06710 [Bacteroidetes bacterium]|nr:MAG: hypothetical protein EAZ53_06710 [Bacteroidota bacterium]